MSSADFSLHPQLAADCTVIGELPLCRVLLMNNANFPWVILVPRIAGVQEIFELPDEDQWQLTQETSLVARALAELTDATKMNIAALGNVVPQLHMHVIARFENDPAWPNPVWNSGIAPKPYSPAESQEICRKLCAATNITKM